MCCLIRTVSIKLYRQYDGGVGGQVETIETPLEIDEKEWT